MKFAISLGTLREDLWVAVSEEADRLGYESVWIPEHLVLPVAMGGSPHAGDDHPPIPPETPVFDALEYLTFIAARTQRLHLGTQVYNIGLRHPFVTARAVATLERLSGDRLELGIGASWLQEEWEAVQLDFEHRGSRVDECIEVCRRLWVEPEVEHHGRWFDFATVKFEPKPPSLPRLHVGGDGAAAFRRAATIGDGWIPMNHSLEQLPASIRRIGELREQAGRPGRTEITFFGQVATAADVEPYEQVGVDRLFVRPWRRSAEAIDGLRRLADELGLDQR
jgi:probable F420-dependent oxidoreductase